MFKEKHVQHSYLLTNIMYRDYATRGEINKCANLQEHWNDKYILLLVIQIKNIHTLKKYYMN